MSAPGRLYNWLFGTICDWLAYLNGLNTDADFLGLTFVWTAAHKWATSLQVSGSAEYNYDAARTFEINVPLVPCGDWAYNNADDSNLQIGCGTNLSYWRAQLRLPKGAVITRARAFVNTGGATTSGHRMGFNLTKRSPDKTTPAGGVVGTLLAQAAFGTNSATGGLLTLSTYFSGGAALAETVDNDATYYQLSINSGDQASGTGPGALDNISWVDLQFKMPGLRNG